jgi:uncharacterized protein (DUF3084 family)
VGSGSVEQEESLAAIQARVAKTVAERRYFGSGPDGHWSVLDEYQADINELVRRIGEYEEGINAITEAHDRLQGIVEEVKAGANDLRAVLMRMAQRASDQESATDARSALLAYSKRLADWDRAHQSTSASAGTPMKETSS